MGILNLLKRLFCRGRNVMEYQVKDAEGNVVATFTTEAQGPFTVESAGEAQPNGGGGPGEEQT